MAGKPMKVQSLIFDKKEFPTAASAKKWAKDHGYKSSSVDETTNTWRLRQVDPGKFSDSTFRTFDITTGITAVGAKLAKFDGVNEETLKRLMGMFGEEIVKTQVVKFEQERGGSFATLAGENKEIFDGTKYLNSAPGERVFVTEDNAVKKTWNREIAIKKSDVMKRIVIGEVYVPFDPNDESTVDTQGMAATAEDIEKAAYGFMEELTKATSQNIDVQHNFKPGYGVVVESYIAKAGDPMFKEGTWVMGVKVTDGEIWDKIQKGEITGFSLAGSARLE